MPDRKNVSRPRQPSLLFIKLCPTADLLLLSDLFVEFRDHLPSLPTDTDYFQPLSDASDSDTRFEFSTPPKPLPSVPGEVLFKIVTRLIASQRTSHSPPTSNIFTKIFLYTFETIQPRRISKKRAIISR